ncbi:MAG: restriction endonuclease subunit S [Muribaculaceae bacterium]|nr:restriction endonuclease subunit S [Muribaculaceae bacterium]
MQSSYKRLGDYIRQVDVRNRDLTVTELVGLTIDKAFIPSVANTIGTDLSSYKVISHNQFACSLMQVSRDRKMPVAIFKGDKAIMSPAYPMFEVSREDELMPEFLMMWFSRKEFDREVTFWAVGGVRGSLTWEDFMNLHIPVPPIEDQRKIVAEYQAVERRIENNRRLIATLEATAQTIYRKMFVDNIDPNNLPEGWHMGSITELSDLKVGGDKPPIFSASLTQECKIPIYSNGVIDEGLYGYTNTASISSPSFTISARGTIGKCFLRLKSYFSIVRLISVVPKNSDTLLYQFFYFSHKTIEGDGSVQNQLTAPFLASEKMIIPTLNSMVKFNSKTLHIYRDIENINTEIQILEQILSLFLLKLSKL